MTLRLAAAAALVVAGALAVPAGAAPKTLCLQIVDDPGDASFAGTSHDALDVVSADIATGKRNLAAVVRFKSLAADPVLTGGTTYTFGFSIGGVPHTFTYKTYATGETLATLTVGTGLDAVTDLVDAVVDRGASTLTWSVSRRAVLALRKTGAKLSGLSVTSAFATNAAVPGGSYSFSTPVDSASTGRPYTDMTPTCLKGV